MHSLPSEGAAVVGTVDPQTCNNNTFATDAVDMSKFHDALFVLLAGTIPTSGTLDFKLQESNASDFSSGVTDISGKSITQFGASDDNKQAVVNLRSDECSKRYARGLITASAHDNIAAAVALGMRPRFGPASDDDLASVAQIVT